MNKLQRHDYVEGEWERDIVARVQRSKPHYEPFQGNLVALPSENFHEVRANEMRWLARKSYVKRLFRQHRRGL